MTAQRFFKPAGTPARLAALLASALLSAAAHAAPFNPVLADWAHRGDVAVQNGSTLVLTTATASFEDDAPLDAGYFNVSGRDAVAVGTPGGLESFIGVPVGSLDPDPVDHTAALYEGSAARLTFDVQAGDTLQFDWNLLTADTWMPDPALLIVGTGAPGTGLHQAYTLGNALQATTPTGAAGLSETGWQTWRHTFTQGGTVTVSLAVADHTDHAGTSQLHLRNAQVTAVPEPGTVLLLVAGMAIMMMIGWRQDD